MNESPRQTLSYGSKLFVLLLSAVKENTSLSNIYRIVLCGETLFTLAIGGSQTVT